MAGSGITLNTVSPGIVREDPATGAEAGKAGKSRPCVVADLFAFVVLPVAGAISAESIAVGHRIRGAILR